MGAGSPCHCRQGRCPDARQHGIIGCVGSGPAVPMSMSMPTPTPTPPLPLIPQTPASVPFSTPSTSSCHSPCSCASTRSRAARLDALRGGAASPPRPGLRPARRPGRRPCGGMACDAAPAVCSRAQRRCCHPSCCLGRHGACALRGAAPPARPPAAGPSAATPSTGVLRLAVGLQAPRARSSPAPLHCSLTNGGPKPRGAQQRPVPPPPPLPRPPRRSRSTRWRRAC
jgi:hypothetical protein